MDTFRNQWIYDSSSSSLSVSDVETDESNEKVDANFKRKRKLSTEHLPDIKNLNAKENIIYKIFNRERTGYFANRLTKQKKEKAFKKVPKQLRFCLKEIVPYCYLKGHVFMGLTVCGQFLLSYKVTYNEEQNSHAFIFNTDSKYELYFWIYRPHQLLGKFFKVRLFDDHGVDSYKKVTMIQWISNPRTLIIHGASETEEGNSHVTIVAVPKLGCLECKKMRDDYSDDYFRCDALCIKCNLTIHTKYNSTETDPKFKPEINLGCPNYIIMIGNGFIHVINFALEVPKTIGKANLSIYHNLEMGYLNKNDNLSSHFYHNDDSGNSSSNGGGLIGCVSNSNNININNGNFLASKKISHIENHYKSDDSNNIIYGCDINKINNSSNKNSIVEGIIADFAESENEMTGNDKNQFLTVIDKTYKTKTKDFDELVITCSASINPEDRESNPSNGINKNETSSVRLINHPKRNKYSNSYNTIGKRIRMLRSIAVFKPSGISSILPTSSTSSSATSSKQVYEFSEDNEKCEKISIFRKRRLADKKYEFSDYNSENIIPFNINLRKHSFNRVASSSFAQQTTSSIVNAIPSSSSTFSSQQHILNCGLYSSAPPTYEVTSHLHRASPSHGFRSPCGSPVGNRCLRSPPGISKTTYFNSRSPTYCMRSPTTSLNLSPRQYTKKSSVPDNLNELNYVNTYSPKSDCNDSTTTNSTNGIIVKDFEKPVCSKKFVRHFVEENDATSVITSEEDDCISPGYHTSLPMEVHGSCYSDMQMISHASYQKLKCPTVMITQHSFDLETFSFHVANHLCTANNKKYHIFYDWACEVINVCSISCIITLLIMVRFTASDQLSNEINCFNCSSNLDCIRHRKHYQCKTLLTWNIESGAWNVLDYGDLHELPSNEHSSELSSIACRTANELRSKLNQISVLENLKVLDSCIEKSKGSIVDIENSIAFYRNRKDYYLSNSENSDEFGSLDSSGLFD